MQIDRNEMDTIASELRIRRALKAMLPPATKYPMKPCDDVLVYREQDKKWNCSFTDKSIIEKQVCMY